jgi:hypothetical protein
MVRDYIDDVTQRNITGVLEDANMAETENIHELKGMNTAIRQFFGNFLGPHHIDNAMAGFLGKEIRSLKIRANRRARTINDNLENLERKINKKEYDTKKMFQRREDGSITGRTLDINSAEYWRRWSDIQNNDSIRSKVMIELNPEVLFTDKHPQEKAKLMAEFEAQVPKYARSRYMDEAKEQWKNYNAQRDIFMSNNPTTEQLNNWEQENSPAYRANNLGQSNTSDNFLVSAPRTVNTEGIETGFYDKEYAEMIKNPEAKALYDAIREASVNQQEALQNFGGKFRPPELAFINQGAVALMRDGKKDEAIALMQNEAKAMFTSKMSDTFRKTDELGRFVPNLENGMHSVKSQIDFNMQKILKANPEYQAIKDLTPLTAASKNKLRAMREKAFKQASSEVERHMSLNILPAIMIANYDTEMLIEKKKSEADIALILREFDSKLKGVGGTDASNQAKVQKAKEIIQYVVYRDYYGLKEMPSDFPISFLSAEEMDEIDKKIDKGERVITVESLIGVSQRGMRDIVLGWSPTLAIRNVFQGFFSNIFKGVEALDYNLKDLQFGYKNVFTKKARDLVDYYYILGDVQHNYDQENIQKDSAKWREFTKSMALTSEVEKINQGVTLLSVFNNIKVTDSETGEKMSLYDAVQETGELDNKYTSDEFEGLSGEDLVIEALVTRVIPTAMEAHGDFHSKLFSEKFALGKLSNTFTKFIYEMTMDRFGGRRMHHERGRMVEGRFLAAVRKLSSIVINKKWANIDKESSLGKRLLEFSGKTDEITEAGARAALAESVIIASLFILSNGLRKVVCDKPECDNQAWFAVMALNSLNDVTNDLIGVTFAPYALAEKSASPVALAGTTAKFLRAGGNFALWASGSPNARYKRDTEFYDKGDLKLEQSFDSLMPVWNNLTRFQRMGSSMRNSNYLVDFMFAEE